MEMGSVTWNGLFSTQDHYVFGKQCVLMSSNNGNCPIISLQYGLINATSSPNPRLVLTTMASSRPSK